MEFEGLTEEGKASLRWHVYSVGGGALKEDKDFEINKNSIYPLTSMTDILEYNFKEGLNLLGVCREI